MCSPTDTPLRRGQSRRRGARCARRTRRGGGSAREAEQREVAEVFERGGVERAVVVSDDDAFALRMALMVRDADPGVELLITFFDSATAGELRDRIKNCRTVSMAGIVSPTLAGPCLDESLGAVSWTGGSSTALAPMVTASRRFRVPVPDAAGCAPDRRASNYDKSGGLLVYGALGLAVILLMESFAAALRDPTELERRVRRRR